MTDLPTNRLTRLLTDGCLAQELHLGSVFSKCRKLRERSLLISTNAISYDRGRDALASFVAASAVKGPDICVRAAEGGPDL